MKAGGPERLPKGKGKRRGMLAWKQWAGSLRWDPSLAGSAIPRRGQSAQALCGTPFQLSAVTSAPSPGVNVLQSLFEGPQRMSAYTFATVKRRGGAGVQGGMMLLADEP